MSEVIRGIAPYCESSGLAEVQIKGGARKFAGSYHGRELSIEAHRSSRTRNPGTIQTRVYDGHRLNITLSTPLMTRMVIASKAHTANPATGAVAAATSRTGAPAVNRNMGAEPVTGLGEPYSGLGVEASEPSWAAPTLNHPEVASLVGYLLADGAGSSKSKLTLGPGTLWLQMVTTGFAPEQVGYWVSSMERLLTAMEAQPAPTVRAELTRLEKAVLKSPGRTVALVFGGIILAGLVFSALLMGAAVLLAG